MNRSRGKMLIHFVLPTLLSSVCFFLFTIVDGIFVGHGVGTNALGAVNIVMPFVMVVNALFMLTTIGGVTVIAIRLGRGDQPGANQAFMHAVTATLGVAGMLSLLGVFLAGPISRMLGANDTFHAMTVDYLFWYSLFILPSGLSIALQGFCRNDGAPVLVSAAVIVGTLCNIVGDWLFIFPLKMGVKGAAIATGLSQLVTLGIVLTHFLRKRGSLAFRKVRLQAALFQKIALRGLPESISQLSTPVATLCMNHVLLTQFGEIGVNAFSIISYVASFSVAIFFGTAEGLQPLIGRCYGARQEKEMKYYFHAGLWINFAGSLLINLLLLYIGGSVCALFGADETTLKFTTQCMPQYAWGFILMSFNTMITAYLYSTKRSRHAIWINLLRGLIVNTLVILALPALFGGGIVWYTFGIYEAIVLLVAVALLKSSERGGVVFA